MPQVDLSSIQSLEPCVAILLSEAHLPSQTDLSQQSNIHLQIYEHLMCVFVLE